MKRLVQILILLILAFLITPLFISKSVEKTIEAEINQPINLVFEEFNNLKNFSSWEPWSDLDSTINKEFFSPYRGTDAGYKWSKSETVFGDFTISKSNENKNIEFSIEGQNLGENATMTVDFIRINDIKTKLTWTVKSDTIGYFSRYFVMYKNHQLDDILKKGIQNLESKFKRDQQSKKSKVIGQNEITTEEFEGLKLIVIPNQTTLDPEEIKTAKEESLGKLFSYLTDFLKVNPNELGSPICYYEYVDVAGKKAKFYCGYVIEESIKIAEDMQIMSLPAKKTIISLHKGNYDKIPTTLDNMKKFAKENNYQIGNSYWEIYLQDPDFTKNQNDLLTKIQIPVK